MCVDRRFIVEVCHGVCQVGCDTDLADVRWDGTGLAVERALAAMDAFILESAEQMMETIGEIAGSTGKATEITAQAVGQAESSATRIVTTREISENIGQASLGIQEVAANIADTSVAVGSVAHDITELNREATGLNEGSSKVASEAFSLNRLSEGLENSVGQFSL